MDEQENNLQDNIGAPEEAPLISDMMLPRDKLPRIPLTDEQSELVRKTKLSEGGDSTVGGNSSDNAGRTKNDNRLVWIVLIVMTVMCIAVGICSAVITARLVQRGMKPTEINTDGKVQQNISAVVAARKNSITEVRCGSLSSSGIAMKRDGKNVIVLTNAHAIAQYVTETTANLHVRFMGDDNFYGDVSVVGYDGLYDVAVLSVPVKDELAIYDIDGSDVVSPDVKFVDGDYVVSIGNAMNMGISYYDGIISRKSELLECDKLFGASGKKTVPVFRTTAVINAGMSGGGVFDMNGRLVGLGTYRMSNTTGVNTDGGASTDVENTGFATPMSVVYPVYRRILDTNDGGAVGLFAVTAEKTNSAIGLINLPQLGFTCEYRQGELTVKTVSFGTAVKSGDIIKKVGDKTVTSDICEVTGAFLRYHRTGSGKALSVTVSHDGVEKAVTFDGFRYAI